MKTQKHIFLLTTIMKTNKISALTTVTPIALLALLLFSGCSSEENNSSNSGSSNTGTIEILSSAEQKPERKAELFGKITGMVGNEITIAKTDTSKDPTFGMEQAEKRAYMTALSDADKMALKEKIQNAVIGEVKVLVPVGIPMTIKKEQGSEAPELDSSLADIRPGKVVSVWVDENTTNRNIATFVKISYSR